MATTTTLKDRFTTYTFTKETNTVTWDLHGNKRTHTFKANKAWSAKEQMKLFYNRLHAQIVLQTIKD